VGEALFVARKGSNPSEAGLAAEDDGYLITTLLDGRGRKSSVAILDAKTLESGPIAELRLKNPLPIGFHCLWSEQYHGPK
jgi:all-trans-8'-apo-beta-carotenal 15,15'-oxygenase